MQGFFRAFEKFDRGLFRFEGMLATFCVGAMSLLMLVNVTLRSLGHPLIWGDELAVHLMVWSAFLGASMAIAARQQVAVDLLAEHLGTHGRLRLAVLVDVLVLAAVMIVAVLVWRWFDLPGLMRTGSAAALSAETFNFIYQEPTLTLGVPKVLFWAVLPLFCTFAAVHALTVLRSDLRQLLGREA